MNSLLFFDGPAMQSYYFPSRASEQVFCLDAIQATSCALGHGFDPDRTNLSISVFQIVPSQEDDSRRRSIVLATRDIPHHSYIGLENLIHLVHLPKKSRQLSLQFNSRYSSGRDGVAVIAASRLGDVSTCLVSCMDKSRRGSTVFAMFI
jgi:hypothetical protein